MTIASDSAVNSPVEVIVVLLSSIVIVATSRTRVPALVPVSVKENVSALSIALSVRRGKFIVADV